MSGCCDCFSCPGAQGVPASGSSLLAGLNTRTIALAGNPNSGKTTIFNALTGLRQKVANYPGVTVEKKLGLCRLEDGSSVQIIDLPGTYSLISRSPDERVAMEVLRGLRPDTPRPDAVVVVLDASNLQRNLYLLSQLVEMGTPMVVALNMMDVAKRRGVAVSAGALERALRVPVVPLIGHKRHGVARLKQALAKACVPPAPDWSLPGVMQEEIALIGGKIGALGLSSAPQRCRNLAERLLVGDEAKDLCAVSASADVAAMLSATRQRLKRHGIDPMEADIEAHYRWIEEIAAKAADEQLPGGEDEKNASVDVDEDEPPLHFSERLDSILVHKVWGLLIFAALMSAMFLCMFSLSAPVQDWLEGALAALGTAAASVFTPGPLQSLVRDGIFAGVGSVAVFVPQIAILFLFLAVLEDSGYLARAAFLMDRLLSKVGLHGKSFIPLLSGFACAIPGIMATRTIENRKDRLATIIVLPFMTCSARLPIYTLLVGTFFAAYSALAQAGIMLLLYVLGIVAAALVAWLSRRTLLKGGGTGFILELPSYKFPQFSLVARQVWSNSSKFLLKAGTTIFAICLVLWALSYYPRLPESVASGHTEAGALASAQQKYSIAGRLGHAIEPVIRPLGFDWKIGIACIGAFAAREVFVSTLAIVYGTDQEGDGDTNLAKAMQADKYPDGTPVWTPLVAASVLLWFVLAMQCLSTVMVVRQETNSWGWAAFVLIYMNVMAYAASFLLFQLGSLL